MILPLLIALASASITPSIAPTPTTAEANEIQKIREVVQQKVKEKLQQIVNPVSSKKAIIGKVIQIETNQITIDYQNVTRSLNVSTDTIFIDASRNKSSLSKIKIGQDILAMGINNSDSSTFDAKRIVFIDLKTVEIKRTTIIGKIVDLSKSSPVFTLIPSHNKNILFQIKTDSKTEFISANSLKIKSTDLVSGHKIIAVLIPDEKVSKTYTALKIIDFDYVSQSTLPTPTKNKIN
jgi:hypothetical protein